MSKPSSLQPKNKKNSFLFNSNTTSEQRNVVNSEKKQISGDEKKEYGPYFDGDLTSVIKFK